MGGEIMHKLANASAQSSLLPIFQAQKPDNLGEEKANYNLRGFRDK